jgi:hypothetical protein
MLCFELTLYTSSYNKPKNESFVLGTLQKEKDISCTELEKKTYETDNLAEEYITRDMQHRESIIGYKEGETAYPNT